MKRLKKNLLAVVLISLVMCFADIHAFAAVSAVTDSFNAADVQEINNAMPATAKTKLGTRLQGLLQRTYSTITTDGEQDLDETDAIIFFETTAVQGTSETAFGEGFSNQILTLVLTTDGGQDVNWTPTTKTGFSSVTLQDANDSCSFRYTDSTKGWVLLSNSGCTIN